METSGSQNPARTAEHRPAKHPQRSRQMPNARRTGPTAGPVRQSPRSDDRTRPTIGEQNRGPFSRAPPAWRVCVSKARTLAEIICCKSGIQREATKSSDHQPHGIESAPTAQRDGGHASAPRERADPHTIGAFYAWVCFRKVPDFVANPAFSRHQQSSRRSLAFVVGDHLSLGSDQGQ